MHYHVSIDTSTFAGADGQLSIQFNPGAIPGAPDAQALISHLLVTGGALGALTLDGGASGVPTGQATLAPSALLNRLLQSVTFGSRVEFDVDLVGPGLSTPAHGSYADVLAVQVLAADGKTPLLDSDASDSVLRLDLNPDGATQAHIASPAVVLSAGGSATVAEAGLDAEFLPFTVQEGQPFSGPVASVTNNNPLETASEMHAVIDWGDGTPPTAGTITGADGQFVVRGTHTYTSAGHYQPIIDVTEREGVTVQAGTPSGGGGVGASPAIKGPMLTGGDFNGDGRSDLVLFVTQPDLSTKPMVVLMQSDGTLGAPIALPASVPTANIQGAIAADFTGDGKLDLAIRRFDTTVGNYIVQVLIGNGDGTFQAGPVSAAVGSSVSMAVGDFNGDHHADLVLGQQSAFTFKVLLGNGDGSFGAPAVYSLPTSLPAITVGDFNRDGRDDLAVTNGQFGTSPIGTDVYLAAPDGTFGTRVSLPGSAGMTIDAAADLTGDAILDLVGHSGDGTKVEIFAGRGDGTFAAPVSYGVSLTVTSLSVGDMNNDRRPDIVAIANATGDLAILLTGPAGQAPRLTYELDHIGGTTAPLLLVICPESLGRIA